MSTTSREALIGCGRDSSAAGKQASSSVLTILSVSAASAARNENRIAASKGERVGHEMVDANTPARLVRHVVEVTLLVGRVQMHGCGQEALAHREERRDELERTRGAQQMSMNGLGRADGNRT